MYFYLYTAYFVWRSVLGTRVNDDMKIIKVINYYFKEVKKYNFKITKVRTKEKNPGNYNEGRKCEN